MQNYWHWGQREFLRWGLTQRENSRWGFVLGVTQILCFALGVKQILAILDTNMLVSPTGNCGVGGSKPTPGPNVNGFASQWNIGLREVAVGEG